MQHTQYADPHHLGHHALLRALKYLPLVVIGLVAAYEHSPLLLAVLALAAGLGLGTGYPADLQRLHECNADRVYPDPGIFSLSLTSPGPVQGGSLSAQGP